ncbi:MAG TPA: FCD domain-containing protein, partial [Streptosporangiaceae bacterium]
VVRRNFQHYSPGALARSLAHHLEIVAAARAGEPDWAEAVMRSHLYNARATMLRDQEAEAISE